MFDIFAALFDQTLLTLKLTPKPSRATDLRVAAYAALNTAIRATVLAAFTYGAIRVVHTALSHGPF